MAEGRRGARDSEGGRRTGAGASARDDGSSDGGAVELSLQLRTESSAAAEEKEEKAAPAPARRSMTIFYNGRVCAADVTEPQAWAIISMVNQEILTEQQQRRDHGRHHQDSDGGGHQNPTPAALLRAAHCHAAPSSHQVLSEEAAPPPLISHAAAGLSMKRSLQRFLQKRKTRAAAVASRYAGARPD